MSEMSGCSCDDNMSRDGDDSENEEIVPVSCVKLPLANNIAAYVEKRQLLRETEEISCDSHLVENVVDNYVIVKNILSSLTWQDKLLCKHVCTTWRSAVLALQREHLEPVDFVLDLQAYSIKRAGQFNTEPMAIFTFANTAGFSITSGCNYLTPNPCDPPCRNEHCLIDYIQRNICAPKDCMLTVRAGHLSYMPLPRSITYKHIITNHMFRRSYPFIGGIYIPKIPDVQFDVINIRSITAYRLKKDFFEVVKNLAQDRIIKGVLVYVTEKFLLLSEIENCLYLNYFNEVQPDIPYALGGCIVEDTVLERAHIGMLADSINEGTYFDSENLITVGMFTVPKNIDSTEMTEKHNFDMFSLVIESTAWTKHKIQTAIKEFSKKVPRFEHSVVLKLSCLGRDQKHELEEDYFRAEFPNSRLVGCFGNGELGINHPARSPADKAAAAAPLVKRTRHSGPQLGILYSYATVFVYIGWGKITSPQGPT